MLKRTSSARQLTVRCAKGVEGAQAFHSSNVTEATKRPIEVGG